MAKIPKAYRLEEKIVKALEILAGDNSMANTIEVLVFREAMYKLDPGELQDIFGEEYERLMLMYAVSKK